MALLDHIGIAVQDKDKVEQLFSNLIGETSYKQEDVLSQGVRTHFISAGNTKLELLESLDPASPIARYLEKNREGIHHLAFEVENIGQMWEKVKEKGYSPLGEKPSTGADGKLIFFLHPRDTHGMLIEFCQSQRTPLKPTMIPFGGEELAVFELGEQNEHPLIILHGAAGCTQMETAALATRLSTSFRVYALDFTAHGKSDSLEEREFSRDLFAENVLALYQHFDLARAHLFGFSLGGFIALSLAVEYPERVNALAVHGVNLIWNQNLVDRMIARLDHEGIQEKSPALARYLSSMHGADRWKPLFDRMKEYTQKLPSYSAKHKGPISLDTPALVSSVHDDDLFPLDSTLYVHNELPNSKLAIIPGHRHALQNVDYDVLSRFIKRHFSQPN